MRNRKFSRLFRRSSLAAVHITIFGAASFNLAIALPTVTLQTSLTSPQPLGTSIMLTATGSDTDAGIISYRFEIGPASSSTLSMVRDFSVDNTFLFTPTNQEGNYQFLVIVRNNTTLNKSSYTYSSFAFTSLVVNGAPAVTPTANPLVALFSSPPCTAGGVDMRVSFIRSGSTNATVTPWKPCVAGKNLNFIIAGMRGVSVYKMQAQTWNGSSLTSGPTLTFTTGTPSVKLPKMSVPVPFTSSDSQVERVLLMAYTAGFPMAFDLSGGLIWYYVDPFGGSPLVTRTVQNGSVLMIADGLNSAGTTVTAQQILREIDLEGNTLRETNATRVAEQLVALSGIQSNCRLGGTECLAGAFHHEAVQLPNGHTLTLVDEEKMFTDGTQGSSPTNPVDIIGNIIVDLDSNWQVAGYWRAFDHLDANRAAILRETCINGAAGCPPIILTAGRAQDWLHGNALFYTPSDGSLLYSMRHQDWIVKIDYGSGSGSGNILWTLGKDGSFTINSTDPYPWFSHQHDPGFVQGGTTTLALFDNGNTRRALPPIGLGTGNSRGYVLNLDQVHMTATPVLMTDLGGFSEALGSAELLANGDYHFEAGYIQVTPPYSQAIEVFPNGTLGFTMQTNGIKCYRSFRMPSLYTAPSKD